MRTTFSLGLLVPAAALLAGCSIVAGGRTDTCGTYPGKAGPAVIATRDQELCEVVRLRVLRTLAAATDLSQARLDAIEEKSVDWERRRDLDSLLAAIRRDAGDAVADEVGRAVESVAARPTRPMPADADGSEACLVKGAARGARLALRYARPTVAPPSAGGSP